MMAYVLPNEGSDKPLHHYAVPVDSVEKWTGIVFFSQLPDKLEATLKADSCMHVSSFPVQKGVAPPEWNQQLIAVLIAILLFSQIHLLLHRPWKKKRHTKKKRTASKRKQRKKRKK